MVFSRQATRQLRIEVRALEDDLRPATRAGVHTFGIVVRAAEVVTALASLGYAPALGVGWFGYTDLTVPATMAVLSVGFTLPFVVGDGLRHLVYRRILASYARPPAAGVVGGRASPVALAALFATSPTERAQRRLDAERSRPRPPAPPLGADAD